MAGPRLILPLRRAARIAGLSRRVLAGVMAAGLLSGIANVALLAVITSVITMHGTRTPRLAWGFAALCVVLPVSRFVSQFQLLRLTQKSLLDLRLELCGRLLAAPLRRLEELGPHRILATLTDDVGVIVTALVNLPSLLINGSLVIGCLVYLGLLSPSGLLLLAGFMVAGVASYWLPVRRGAVYLRKARDTWDAVLRHFHGLAAGTKELKQHRERRREFLADLEARGDELRRTRVAGNGLYLAANSWGLALFFVLIGGILFLLPQLPPRTLTGFTLTMIYLMGPLQTLLGTLPRLAEVQVALQKIEDLGLSLGQPSDEEPHALRQAPDGRCLELIQVTHAFKRGAEEGEFVLGPIDLEIRPGELVFLVGGNGSGKTTLAKLITGLYVAESGEIRCGGTPVTAATREEYRQSFSAVFQDCFVFDRLFGLGSLELNQRARSYIEQLQLAHKVRIADGAFSTLDLSWGQRKRLALLTAYLEDRPIYLFDEWAADQDPLFKELFYLHLLRDLRSRGKTIIVISHDERYYETADRIIKLENGSVLQDLERRGDEQTWKPTRAEPIGR